MAPRSGTLAWKIPWTELAWWAAVHGVTRSRIRLSDFTFLSFLGVIEQRADLISEALDQIIEVASLGGC